MIATGLYAVLNSGVPRLYAVDIKPDYAGIAVFVHANEGTTAGKAGSMAWADLLAYLEIPPQFGNAAGFVDTVHDEVFVPDLPGAPHGAIYKGRSYIFANGMNGLDEIADYALLDIAIGPDAQPLPWRNRFAQTAREKVDVSFRHRARERISNALVVFMPIAAPFDQTRIEVLCETDPILLNGTVLTGRIEDATIPKDGVWFKQFYFRAEATQAVTVAPDSRVDLPFQLVWNKDGSPVARELRFKLETDAGYLPRQRVTANAEGQGVITFEARGLVAGDVANIKINCGHYTAVGKLAVEVMA